MADVTLPQLGETVTEGTITQWFKQVGDEVSADEPLFEVSTDKVDTEVPAPAAGTLTEIRAEEGETVDVGAVVAVIGDASDAPSGDGADEPVSEEDAEEQPAPEEAEESEESSADEAGEADEAGASAEPATDEAAADDEEAEPEPTDEEDTEAAETAETAEAEPAGEDEQAETEPAAKPEDEESPSGGDGEGSGSGADTRLLSPVVRRLVNENKLDVGQITGSGPGGRITRDDVLDHLDRVGAGDGEASKPAAEAAAPEAPKPAKKAAAAATKDEATAKAEAAAPAKKDTPAPAAAQPVAAAAPTVTAGDRDTSVPLSKIRRLTGAHMVMSRAVSPHAFSVVEVDYANVDTARNAAKAAWKERNGFSLTYLPFISRAVIDALDDFPHLNASVGEDELVVHGFVDLGIAVDLDYEGLLVPVIRDAETKRLGAIAKEINDLASRARSRKLGPDEISGGTFTISNNGSAGSVLTAAIISQPQVAILSTDAITPKPVAAALPDGTYAVVVHPVGNLAMSWDHRAFDGAYAAGFLKRVKELLETKDWSGEL